MTEVTRKNFRENYDKIVSDLNSAIFISLDCEFSGLFNDNSSLFDTPEKRYEKLRDILSIKNYFIIQLGLTTFSYNKTKNNIFSSTYSFYLMPDSVFQTKREFSCQTDGIEFLCKSNFNFNRLFYEGVNYVNEPEENHLIRMLEEENFSALDKEEAIEKYCSQISDWESNSSSDEYELLMDASSEGKDYLVNLIHLIIRKKYPNLWTFSNESHGTIKVIKVNEFERAELLAKDEHMKQKAKLHESILGFTNIMKQIKNLKKPIVGHNFLLDLLLIYHQFWGPLPVSYKKFKREITKVFPQVYDTKHMSYHLRNLLQRDSKWTSNSLKDLFDYLSRGKGSAIVLCTPLVLPRDSDLLKSKTFHDAGFDSFCTGFCYIKMSHIYSAWDRKNNSFFANPLPVNGPSFLKASEFLRNRINFPRGKVYFISLDGSDGAAAKLCFLRINAQRNRKLDTLKIVNEVAKYSSVDIISQNRNTAIVAVRNEKQANEILARFKNSKEFQVTYYSFVRFIFLEGRMITCSLMVTTLGFFLYKWLRRN